MANLFRAIFRNIFFAGWRVIFQHKEPDDVIETGPGAKTGKTLKELQEEEKKKLHAPKPKGEIYEDMEYASIEEAKAYDNDVKLFGFAMLSPAAKRLLKSKKEGSLLDIGCGPGRFIIKVLKHSNFNATGFDLSTHMLKIAGENVKDDALAGRATFKQGDLNALPFKDHSFDAVTCLNALHHIKDIKKAIRGFEKVLKPHNSVVIVQDLIKLPWILEKIFPVLLHPFPFTKMRKEMKKQYVESLEGARSIKEWREIVDSTFLKGAEIKVMPSGLMMIVKEF